MSRILAHEGSVPFEIKAERSCFPTRGATADLSLGGCFIENMYPLAVGTDLDLLGLWLGVHSTKEMCGGLAGRDPA
jgi:hypothetical protein